MYSLLIVDDEPLSQVGLKSMLDWESLGVSLIGSASNGLSAFGTIAEMNPDIVIADVRMPLLDGLDLIEKCRSELDGGGPEFIMLSGYADFEAARRAMRNRAVDYLVKLELDADSLRACVEKAKTAVRQKGQGSLGLGPKANGYPFADTALSRLIMGDYASEERAREALAACGIKFKDGHYRSLAFQLCCLNSERLTQEDRLRAYDCSVDMLKQIVGRSEEILAIPLGIDGFAAIVSEDHDLLEELLGRAFAMVLKCFGVQLRAGIGPGWTKLSDAADSYRKASQALAKVAGDKAMARWEEELSRSATLHVLAHSESRRAAVVEALADKAVEKLARIFSEAIADISNPSLAEGEALAICCDLLYPILDTLDEADRILAGPFPESSDGWRQLFKLGGRLEYLRWLNLVRDSVCSSLESSRNRSRNPLVAGVQNYILHNYESRLSLGEVAARFEVSPNYLSGLFKKYGGVGFADYVAKVKIAKAKELILEGKHKIFEVAQMLGFEDAFYFSKVFKRVTGLSPREYYQREGLREPDGSDPGLENGEFSIFQ